MVRAKSPKRVKQVVVRKSQNTNFFLSFERDSIFITIYVKIYSLYHNCSIKLAFFISETLTSFSILSFGIRSLDNLKESKVATRKTPLYTNCYLQANDGELLCTIDRKKAMWYVNKEIGEIISEDPLTVRLKFEPAGRAVGQTGKYYQMPKENKCVVCGETEKYTRKNVVPREYRKHFPCKKKH